MKYKLFILICFVCISCSNKNYYPQEAFYFSEIQKQLLNPYNVNDTISFSNKNSVNSILISGVYEEKSNTYTPLGINTKIQRCKTITFRRLNDVKEYPLISCCVAPKSKEKTIDINFLDRINSHCKDTLLQNKISEMELGGVMFNDIVEIHSNTNTENTKKEIETVYLSLQEGIIGYKLKNNQLWVKNRN